MCRWNTNKILIISKRGGSEHLAETEHQVCVIQKGLGYEEVSRGDRRLGDVLQRAELETAEISRPHDSDFTIYSR